MGEGSPRPAPHSGQNRAVGEGVAPQPGHVLTSGLPHDSQNFAPGVFAAAHCGQMKSLIPPRGYLCPSPERGGLAPPFFQMNGSTMAEWDSFTSPRDT